MKRYESTKEQWNRIKPLLPPEKSGKRGRPRKDDQTVLNGMLWIVRSGAQWRELPKAYGPWQSVYARFAKWRDDGTLEMIFHALPADVASYVIPSKNNTPDPWPVNCAYTRNAI